MTAEQLQIPIGTQKKTTVGQTGDTKFRKTEPAYGNDRRQKKRSLPISAEGEKPCRSVPSEAGVGGFASMPHTASGDCRASKKRTTVKDKRIPKDCRDPLELARNGLLFDLLSLYLEHCAAGGGTSPPDQEPEKGKGNGSKKAKTSAPVGRFPNLAGFCRFLGVGMTKMEALSGEEPEIYDALCAIFEDEALNSGVSASVLTPYFKKRLGYADKSVSAAEDRESGGIRLIFDHDVWEDGA